MMQPDNAVYIVEDDAAVRDSIDLLLRLRGYRTRLFASAEDFLAEVQADWTGCMLLDIRMGGQDGLQLQQALGDRGLSLPIVFVSAYGDVATTRTALKAGAIDFLEKPVDEDALLAAIDSAMAEARERLQRAAKSHDVEARLERLTERERQVLQRVVSGMHNREIAQELGISPRTVEVYKSRMMEKLDVRRVPELIRLMIGNEAAIDRHAQ